MRVLDPLARPLVLVAAGEGAGEVWATCAARGIGLALRARLPAARIEAFDPALAAGADAVVAVAGAEPAGGAATVVTLPAEPSPLTLCTAAMPADLRSRRLRLLRRLRWLPEEGLAVAADRPAEAPAGADGPAWVVGLPAEASVDDVAAVVAAVVAAAPSTAGWADPILSAFAAGAAQGEPPALAEALDRAAEAAVRSWAGRGRPGDPAARLAAARVGARRTLAAVERAASAARVEELEARVRELDAELASIVHSRTWRWSRRVRDAWPRARRRLPGRR